MIKQNFSAAGAAQIASDVDHILGVVNSATGASGSSGVSLQTTKKLSEGLHLLCLDAAGDTLGLWDVEDRLFRDNESARGVLAELGIETLSEADARSVLERRIEVGNR